MLTGKYSIKDIERLSGIKAHTIRIWELRYGILKPERTDTKIRFYNDADLKKILNISFLNRKGYKISKLAGFSEEHINNLLLREKEDNSDFHEYGEQIIQGMMDLNSNEIYSIIAEVTKKNGFEVCFEEVLLPVLEKIGLLWMSGTIEPAREHFLAGIIKNTIQVQIASSVISDNPFRVIIMQLSGDIHELSLLYIHYLFSSRNVPVLYLGVSVPPRDLKKILSSGVKPAIYVHSVLEYNEIFEKQFSELIAVASGHRVYVSGKAVLGIQSSEVVKVGSISELKKLIDSKSF
jgi:MerR family transcriptional regulator, light-induced transcriptional regulator